MSRPTPIRRSLRGALLALVLAAQAGLAAAQSAAPSAAQSQAGIVEVTLHVHCFSGVPEAERTRLDYWNAAFARANPDPDCVSRQPLMPPLALRSVSLAHDPESTVELLRLEVDPARYPAMQAALLANQRKMVAVAVQRRIVAVVYIVGAPIDHRIPIYISNKAVAADLASDLKILLGGAR